jgi:D-alanyl-D-alanine dipeptidase
MDSQGLVYIDEYGLLGSNFYFRNHESKGISKEEIVLAGLVDGRVRVSLEIIEPLKRVDEVFKSKGYRLYLKEGYRSKAVYDLVFKKRSEKFGKEETERLINIKDMPHATGKTVDVTIWDPKENKEVYSRNVKDGVEALFIVFYRHQNAPESARYQELQEFVIRAMLEQGFRVGVKREYFHFNYQPDQPINYEHF